MITSMINSLTLWVDRRNIDISVIWHASQNNPQLPKSQSLCQNNWHSTEFASKIVDILGLVKHQECDAYLLMY